MSLIIARPPGRVPGCNRVGPNTVPRRALHRSTQDCPKEGRPRIPAHSGWPRGPRPTSGAIPLASNLVPGIYVCGCSVRNHLGHVRVIPPVVFTIRPPNDDFSESTPLDSIPGTVRGWVGGASWEPREKRPLHVVPNAGSSWWVWTAPETEDFRLRVNTSTLLVLYRGSALGALTTVARFHYGENVFHAVRGETYHLQASSPATSPSGVATETEFTLSR